MRRALATAVLVGGVVLTPTVVAGPAHAAVPATSTQGNSTDSTDADELGTAQDGDDDSGRWGLMGLLGLGGLFGYKKYKEHQASRTGAAVGGVDTDGTGSRRI
ncbi:MAG: hypothetical protein JWM64_931 [Frankiales bacterium]|nr:hypothetical protein [Frankiales bacterium]